MPYYKRRRPSMRRRGSIKRTVYPRAQARLFNRAKSEVAVNRTIFKTTKILDTNAITPGASTKIANFYVGCAGLLFQDQRWVQFKAQFDEFRIVGVKYTIALEGTLDYITQLFTSFDRSAAVTANMTQYLTYQNDTALANQEIELNLNLSNPSCRETIGTGYMLPVQQVTIYPVTPVEKVWIGTAFMKGRENQPQVSPTFMSAFNPKLHITAVLVNYPADIVKASVVISTELYIETRGSKMK